VSTAEHRDQIRSEKGHHWKKSLGTAVLKE